MEENNAYISIESSCSLAKPDCPLLLTINKNAYICLKLKLAANLLFDLSCDTIIRPARSVLIQDVVVNAKKTKKNEL